MSQKPYVRIHSSVTINVTPGLQNQDVTNKDAHVPDRLKVSPLWPKLTVLIQAGEGVYPSEIAEWPTVKALEHDKLLTIGQYMDKADNEAEKKKVELTQSIANIESRTQTTVKDINLADLAKE